MLSVLLGCIAAGCSSTNDSGADLLNQAMNPVKQSGFVNSSKNIEPASINDADLVDDSIPNNLPVVKVSSGNGNIVPLKSNLIADTAGTKSTVVITERQKPLVTTSNNNHVLKTWTILLSDKVISNTLERWAEQGGYQLVWKSNHDFEITSSAVITGSIKNAFNQVLLSFVDSSSPIKATWYSNKVIVITSFNE